MAFSRKPIKVLSVLVAALFVQASGAAADDDMMPDARYSIPSAASEEIAPPGGISYAQPPVARAPQRPAVPSAPPLPSRAPAPRTATDAPPEAEDATARNAAGVADMPSTAGMALAPADATEGASGPVSARNAADATKAGIPASIASPGGDAIAPGQAKSGERLDPQPTAEPNPAEANPPEPGPTEPRADATETVRVPAAVAATARRMLPGIGFSAVDLSRNGPSTLYTLSGTTDQGRSARVAIDQSGTVRTVDRQARDQEIPGEVMNLVEAALPGARIEEAMLSLRPAFLAVYVFTGTTRTGRPFTLEVRSDGRDLSFVDPE